MDGGVALAGIFLLVLTAFSFGSLLWFAIYRRRAHIVFPAWLAISATVIGAMLLALTYENALFQMAHSAGRDWICGAALSLVLPLQLREAGQEGQIPLRRAGAGHYRRGGFGRQSFRMLGR